MDDKEYKERAYKKRAYKIALINHQLTQAAEYAREYEAKAEKYAYLAFTLQEDCKRLRRNLKELEEGMENAKS